MKDGREHAAPRQSARDAGAPTSIRDALQAVLVPVLRDRGFTGRHPHFRRLTPEATHTFTVQVSKWGGEFMVELGRCPAGPYAATDGTMVDAKDLTSHHLRDADRARLSSRPGPRETWFRYAPTASERLVGGIRRAVGLGAPPNPLLRAAQEVVSCLDDCERWWAGAGDVARIRTFASSGG